MISTEIVSIFVAIFFGVAALVLAIKLRKKRSLAYRVMSITPLLKIEDRIKKDIKITFGNEEVKDMHLLLVKIMNNGNEPLLKVDFKKPINFIFNSEAKILEMGLEKLDPADLQIWFDHEADNVGGVTPDLLNPKESFVVKFLITKYEEFKISTRIIGIRELVDLTPSKGYSIWFEI